MHEIKNQNEKVLGYVGGMRSNVVEFRYLLVSGLIGVTGLHPGRLEVSFLVDVDRQLLAGLHVVGGVRHDDADLLRRRRHESNELTAGHVDGDVIAITRLNDEVVRVGVDRWKVVEHGNALDRRLALADLVGDSGWHFIWF